jgi:hypothetical protein
MSGPSASARGGAVLLSGLYPGLRPVMDWRGVNVRLVSGGEGSGRLGHYFPGR